VLPILEPLLNGSDPDKFNWTSRRVAEVLGEVGPPAASTAPALWQLLERAILDHESRGLQVFAIALGRIGPSAVAPLTKLLEHPNAEVRARAAVALGCQRDHATLVVPALLKLVDDRDHEARIAAVEALAGLGRDASPALPRLRQLALAGWTDPVFNDLVEDLRITAELAIEAIQAGAANPSSR